MERSDDVGDVIFEAIRLDVEPAFRRGGSSVKRNTTPSRTQTRNIFAIVVSVVVAVWAIGYFVWFRLIQPIVKAQQAEATKLNAILNSIADGVLVQGLSGEIETMNPRAQKIIDETIDSTSLQKIDDTTKEARSRARLSSLLSFLTNLHFFETETVEIGRRVLSARAAPIVNAEEKIGSVVVLRDITAEAESKRLKDDFITTVSHELRTPLSVIKGYNDLLRMNADHIFEEHQTNFLRNIERVDQNIETLLNLIEQMLDLTQINAGALGIDRERINLPPIVKAEAEYWRDSMTEKKLDYQLALPNEDIWVQGDENRLTRVVHNLLKNAHHYTLPGGQVEISMQPLPNQVQVSVRDTGVGIAERDKPLIFTRFFRAIHAETTYEVGGAGLGLFLSRAIIEAHDGQIWFESEANRGSTFSFCLPTVTANSNNKMLN